jgi:hypothetical protein
MRMSMCLATRYEKDTTGAEKPTAIKRLALIVAIERTELTLAVKFPSTGKRRVRFRTRAREPNEPDSMSWVHRAMMR